MLADCLTKTMDASRLRECLRTGKYSLSDEGMVLKERADKRKKVQWIKECIHPDEKKLASDETPATEVSLYSKGDDEDFWRIDHNKGDLERVHRRPRWRRFTPIGVHGCPVRFQEIGVDRRHLGRGFRSETEPWTGVTRFKMEQKVPEQAHSIGSTPQKVTKKM